MKELNMNPYVVQMDKFAKSLEKLSKICVSPKDKESVFSEEELVEIYHKTKERSCADCDHQAVCWGNHRHLTYNLLREVFQSVEDCGTELSIEVKRKVQNSCVQATRFLQHAVTLYKDEKQQLLWERKMAQNREGYANQLGSVANMLQHVTRELDASIFADEHMDKKIRNQCVRAGLKVLTTVFLVAEVGRYEIHVTARAQKGCCVTTKTLAEIISDCCGRNMILGPEERNVIGQEYCTVTFVEDVRFHTLSGVARVGKGRHKISGDSFSLFHLPGGKQGAILSDGMGAGEAAFQESSMVIELLEELLEAGFSPETALQMLNTALVVGRDKVVFSTIDMAIFDLYRGECELFKAGAATTFLKRGDKVESISSTSLPIGVVSNLELGREARTLEDGDLLIMVTDGVMDALPNSEQDFLIKMILEGTNKTNPKEFAQYVMEQVLTCSGELPLDDMTVLVVGIWSLEK